MKTVILCGGKGTRAYPHTATLPKLLLKVGDAPILRHLMEIFARQGFLRFRGGRWLRGDLIEEFAGDLPPDWVVNVAHTGEQTGTGGACCGADHVWRIRFWPPMVTDRDPSICGRSSTSTALIRAQSR